MTPQKISTKSSYPPPKKKKKKKKISFLKNPNDIEIQNFEPQKIARAYVICMYENIRVPPSPKIRPDGPKMKNLPSSQIWNFKHLFLFGTSHKSAC